MQLSVVYGATVKASITEPTFLYRVGEAIICTGDIPENYSDIEIDFHDGFSFLEANRHNPILGVKLLQDKRSALIGYKVYGSTHEYLSIPDNFDNLDKKLCEEIAEITGLEINLFKKYVLVEHQEIILK